MAKKRQPFRQRQGGTLLKTLKFAAVYRMEYETFADVADDLLRFIDKV